MTGLELYTYLRRRLNEIGVSVPAAKEAELYDYLTEARDDLKAALALAAPIAALGDDSYVTLEEDGTDDRLHSFPNATADPLRILEVRAKTTREPLTPASSLDFDGGEYVWITHRKLRLGENVSPTGGVEVIALLHAGDITSATTEAQVGLPTPTHRAIGKFAAVLALTADENSDAQVAMGLLQREIDKLERLYSEFDANGGMALREALLANIGTLAGDRLY